MKKQYLIPIGLFSLVVLLAAVAVTFRRKNSEYLSADGVIMAGDDVKEIVSKYGSRIGTDMAAFANKEISCADKYKLCRVPLDKLLSSDAELRTYVEENVNSPEFKNKPKDNSIKPILIQSPQLSALISAPHQVRTGIVRDGYKRVTIAYRDKCPDILAFVKIS